MVHSTPRIPEQHASYVRGFDTHRLAILAEAAQRLDPANHYRYEDIKEKHMREVEKEKRAYAALQFLEDHQGFIASAFQEHVEKMTAAAKEARQAEQGYRDGTLQPKLPTPGTISLMPEDARGWNNIATAFEQSAQGSEKAVEELNKLLEDGDED